MYPNSSNGLNKETEDSVYFFTPAFYPLDNLSPHMVTVWNITFPTAEHAYQWKKYSENRKDISEMILNAKSPHLAKEISDSHKSEQPAGWHERKVQVMEEILRAKADQHQDVRDTLKKTGNRIIIENSPVDSFWGCGANGKGENHVGKLWMKIRDELGLSK